ncbi:phosphoribosyltransferase-like protein [Micromonospora humida]|uniref:PRTase-CE domain-containing protein n=1 Tax=Micromonospora humida TaxID=2809018 RepID=A0ABS2IUY0_9ACTN|nr:hypothetical protein [Micromonospora humida]MBM7078073.1 hypothetical protein [Micromonospora humida]
MENFYDKERETAALLIDSLRFVSTGKVRTELENEILSGDRYQKPVAFYPIRSLDDFPSVIKAGGIESKPVAFKDFSPTEPLRVAPGSEALAANLLRTIAKAYPEAVMGPDSDLATLRTRRCRSIVLVEDYAGSGDQCLQYLQSWLANRTLRSWHSFGWVRFHVLLHSVAPKAHSFIKLLRPRDLKTFTALEVAPTVDDAGWTAEQMKRVKKLCHRRAANRELALGHKGSGGLLVMQHTVPDNLPMILWQTGGHTADGQPWRPFLPNRSIPPSLGFLASNSYAPPTDYPAAADRLDDGRVTATLAERVGPRQQEKFYVLGACIRGIRQTDRLAAEARASLQGIKRTVRTLQGWGYIDERLRPTDCGRRAFARHAALGSVLRIMSVAR